MQALVFHFRRLFYLLGDSIFMPFRFMVGLWRDGSHGRTLLFGLPSIAVFLFAVVCALVAFGSQKSLKREYEQAKTAAQANGDHAAAITYGQKLYQLDQSDKAKFELALLLISDDSESTGPQNRARAQAMIDSLAPDDRPGYPQAHVMKAQHIAVTPGMAPDDRIKLVEKQLQLALTSDANNISALTMSAEIKTLKREYEDALKIYIQLFDQNVALHRKIAEIYHILKRGDEAKYYVEKAIERYGQLLTEKPGNVDYIRRIGNAHAMLARFDKAVEVLREAIEKEKDEGNVELLKKALSNIHVAWSQSLISGSFKEDDVARQKFLDQIIEAYQMDSTNGHAMRLLTEFADAGFPESNTARSVYDPRIDPDSADASVLQGIGTRELLYGNRELGISLLEKGLQKNPDNHTIMNNLAYAMMDVDLDRSEKLSEKSIVIAPGIFNYYDTHGNIMMRKGNFEKAISDFHIAIAKRPKGNDSEQEKENERAFTSKVFRSLAFCYEKLGLIDDAASYSRRADEAEKAIIK